MIFIYVQFSSGHILRCQKWLIVTIYVNKLTVINMIFLLWEKKRLSFNDACERMQDSGDGFFLVAVLKKFHIKVFIIYAIIDNNYTKL